MKQEKARRKRAFCALEKKAMEARQGLWMNSNGAGSRNGLNGIIFCRCLPPQRSTGTDTSMKFPSDLVPQKAVAADLCVSIVTLWRARQSGIPEFPEPVVIRNMIFWRRDEVRQLEDALMKYQGRGRFEADRMRAKRAVIIERKLSKVKRSKRTRRKSDERQLHLF
jgi:hypothetical protein